MNAEQVQCLVQATLTARDARHQREIEDLRSTADRSIRQLRVEHEQQLQVTRANLEGQLAIV